MSPLIPSIFLPPLPRLLSSLPTTGTAATCFLPLPVEDILVQIAILRQLYIPPIHGGLSAFDTGYGHLDHDQKSSDLSSVRHVRDRDGGQGADAGKQRQSRKERDTRITDDGDKTSRSSLGLGLGLELRCETGGEGSGTATPRAIPPQSSAPRHLDDLLGSQPLSEANEHQHDYNHISSPSSKSYRNTDSLDLELEDLSNSNLDEESGSSEQDEEDEEDEVQPHLDPFEREWAEKWLNGVVRRVQLLMESHDEDDENEDGVDGNLAPKDEADADADLFHSGLGEVKGLKDSKAAQKLAEITVLEGIQRDATGVLALMAGTSAAGSLTRHLLFPISRSLEPALRRYQKQYQTIPIHHPNLSPSTTTFLNNLSLSVSPTSPISLRNRMGNHSVSPTTSNKSIQMNGDHKRDRRASNTRSTSSFSSSESHDAAYTQENRRRPSSTLRKSHRRRRRSIPILLHDAPMGDHLSVGVQTWGSAILLGREIALNPYDFGLFPSEPSPSHSSHTISRRRPDGTRVLELGAGTGLLSILCRKLLDLYELPIVDGDRNGSSLTNSEPEKSGLQPKESIVIATDFLPSVLGNLQICVDLNFPSSSSILTSSPTSKTSQPKIQIAKLDWKTFPNHMNRKYGLPLVLDTTVSEGKRLGHENRDGDSDGFIDSDDGGLNDVDGFAPGEVFDLVLASDCVYDPTHAKMLRDVAAWVLRLPSEDGSDQGGTFHILSPIRPTFTPELESIDQTFPPISSYMPLETRQSLARSKLASSTDTLSDLPCLFSLADNERGEGLGLSRGLKLGVRGGKRSVVGRKGEGRIDEVAGYWWWEVGWG